MFKVWDLFLWLFRPFLSLNLHTKIPIFFPNQAKPILIESFDKFLDLLSKTSLHSREPSIPWLIARDLHSNLLLLLTIAIFKVWGQANVWFGFYWDSKPLIKLIGKPIYCYIICQKGTILNDCSKMQDPWKQALTMILLKITSIEAQKAPEISTWLAITMKTSIKNCILTDSGATSHRCIYTF